jgi:hypothetical protein
MLGVTMFGIFLTPVFYYVIEWFNDMRRGLRALRAQGLPEWIPRIGRKKHATPAPRKPRDAAVR